MRCLRGMDKWVFAVSLAFILGGISMLVFPEQNNISFAPTSGPKGQPGNTIIRIHSAPEVQFSGIILILTGCAFFYLALPRGN